MQVEAKRDADWQPMGHPSASSIFLSHSSSDNDAAVALYDWLEHEGWKDEIFLDLSSKRGIAPGERWERALHEAADRCEAVLFLVSKAWLASQWCRREFNLAHRLNKRLFGVLIEDLAIDDLPRDLTGDWQLLSLAAGRDHVILHAVVPITHKEVHVHFSAEGLQRLKHGLQRAGLSPKHFPWPPKDDEERAPYRGLSSLDAKDAGIFFGRDAPVIEALDRLRGLREAAAPRMLVILGASGAGKSSFMRAGLLPRLVRDDRHFLPLAAVRPERAAMLGEYGLLSALDSAFRAAKIPKARGELRAAIEGGATKLRPLLQLLAGKAPILADPAQSAAGSAAAEQPTIKQVQRSLVLPIDQGEELFLAEGADEAKRFLLLLRDLIGGDDPALIALFTIRSDRYEALQSAPELEGVRQDMINLPPLPRGSYAEVIKGPALRLEGTKRPLRLEPGLIAKLLADIEEAGGKDSLSLLAFTLERLYLEFGGGGELKREHYETLKGITGSIEAAVERALKEADKDNDIPKARDARLALLRRAFIPWLASIDPETGNARRRVARQSEIPKDAWPLLQKLVDQRLLATDQQAGEKTVEPVHEALLRQWGLLQSWLAEDAGLLRLLEGVKFASRDWVTNEKDPAWLTHGSHRLTAVERLAQLRPDLAENLGESDRAYLAACRKREQSARWQRNRARIITGAALVACLAVGLVGWWQQSFLRSQIYWFTDVRPYLLSADTERSLQRGKEFQECTDCPKMIVVPAGTFMMGSPDGEIDHDETESPRHNVTIPHPLAVGKFEITFDQWDACVRLGGCTTAPPDEQWGRGTRPVIKVDWNDARQYVAWLSKLTGKSYRLLSEAEYEYAERAGSTSVFFWGDEVGTRHAVCEKCGTAWDNKRTAPVGSVPANGFGLYDMLGNVWEMVQDCWQDNYDKTPADGTAASSGNCDRRVVRGGAWTSDPLIFLRSAARYSNDRNDHGSNNRGFRVARTLAAP